MPEEGEALPDINDFPILDQEEAQRIFYARFIKECGKSTICCITNAKSVHLKVRTIFVIVTLW